MLHLVDGTTSVSLYFILGSPVPFFQAFAP